MKSFAVTVLAVCSWCFHANQAGARSTLTLTPTLTHREQARLLGLEASRADIIPIKSVQAADYHVASVKTLLDGIANLKPDGTRSGNPMLRKVEYHLEKARLAGVSYETALTRIYSGDSTAPSLVRIRKQALLTVMKMDQKLGLLTPENMQRLERGEATVVTRGNPKYLGEFTEVDHRVPIRGPNGRAVYENEVGNLQVLPKSLNRTKWAHVDDISKGHEARLDQATWENRYAFAGGLLSTGAGVLLLYTSTRALLDVTRSVANDLTTKLRIGEQGALFAGGAGFTASGVAQLGSRLATTEGALARLGSIAKWGGRAGIVGVIVGEGLGIGIDYCNWDEMTARQRSVSVVQHSVSIGGMVFAFGAGFLIGIETGPGAVAFGLAAAGATYAASKVATGMVEDSYNRLDEAQKGDVRAYIFHHYGVSQ